MKNNNVLMEMNKDYYLSMWGRKLVSRASDLPKEKQDELQKAVVVSLPRIEESIQSLLN